jgi:hypothetical protein
MKKIFYEKVGRRYVPVNEYDSDLLDSFPQGAHLVMSYPGGSSRRHNIDPNYAAMIAAGRVAEEAMCKAMQEASELRPQRKPVTPAQQQAWRKLAKELGDELCTLQGASTHDIVEAGLRAMQTEADRLMQNAAVKMAYDNFLLVCKLAAK